MNKYWGYLHIAGTILIKRYFDEKDIEEAKESPFVKCLVPPIEALDIEEATRKIHKLVENRFE